MGRIKQGRQILRKLKSALLDVSPRQNCNDKMIIQHTEHQTP